MTNYNATRVERKTAELLGINSSVQKRAQKREKSTSGDYYSCVISSFCKNEKITRAVQKCGSIQARIAHLVAYRLGTGEILGSNPGKGDNFSVKISNWIVRI